MTTPAPFFDFLTRLSANNHREWFEANRVEYNRLRSEILDATADIIKRIQRFDPSIGVLTPNECLFRINRDVRFSNDKSPYKTHFGIFMARGGRKSSYAGYYLHLEPGASFIGGGVYMPVPPVLKNIRQEIFYNYPRFKAIVEAPAFVKTFGGLNDMGDRLTRPPKGYDNSFEGIGYLMNKHFVVGYSPDESKFTHTDVVKTAGDVFETMKDFNAFLNVAVGEAV